MMCRKTEEMEIPHVDVLVSRSLRESPILLARPTDREMKPSSDERCPKNGIRRGAWRVPPRERYPTRSRYE